MGKGQVGLKGLAGRILDTASLFGRGMYRFETNRSVQTNSILQRCAKWPSCFSWMGTVRQPLLQLLLVGSTVCLFLSDVHYCHICL